MANYWIKLYIEILNDSKMAVLPDRLWRRTIELFLAAGHYGDEGHLPDTQELAWLFRMNTDDLDLDLKQIATTGIIQRTADGWLVTKFEDRQAPVPGKERVKQYRNRQKKQQYYGDVTQEKRSVTQINRLTESEAEADTETFAPATASQAIRVFGDVTGMMAIPGREEDRSYAIDAILQIGIKHPETVDYLKAYYTAWLSRKYSKTNIHWLDWAIAGEIPPDKRVPHDGRNIPSEVY